MTQAAAPALLTTDRDARAAVLPFPAYINCSSFFLRDAYVDVSSKVGYFMFYMKTDAWLTAAMQSDCQFRFSLVGKVAGKMHSATLDDAQACQDDRSDFKACATMSGSCTDEWVRRHCPGICGSCAQELARKFDVDIDATLSTVLTNLRAAALNRELAIWHGIQEGDEQFNAIATLEYYLRMPWFRRLLLDDVTRSGALDHASGLQSVRIKRLSVLRVKRYAIATLVRVVSVRVSRDGETAEDAECAFVTAPVLHFAAPATATLMMLTVETSHAPIQSQGHASSSSESSACSSFAIV